MRPLPRPPHSIHLPAFYTMLPPRHLHNPFSAVLTPPPRFQLQHARRRLLPRLHSPVYVAHAVAAIVPSRDVNPSELGGSGAYRKRREENKRGEDGV